VAQGEGSEFKPQYQKEKKKKILLYFYNVVKQKSLLDLSFPNYLPTTIHLWKDYVSLLLFFLAILMYLFYYKKIVGC
jgi:hypothetical protein